MEHVSLGRTETSTTSSEPRNPTSILVRKIGSLPRMLISSFFVLISFYIAPHLINYGENEFFTKKEFDFGDPVFWGEINSLSETLSSDQRLRKMNGNRGSKHFIYINRTFFGLYTLLNDLKAKVNTEAFRKYC